MIIEKLDALCVQNGTSLTALCKEITGSSGNLPTWKKDNIRPSWLREICLKFKISSDYLLDIQNPLKSDEEPAADGREVFERYMRLNPDNRIKAQAYMIDLYEKQEAKYPAILPSG